MAVPATTPVAAPESVPLASLAPGASAVVESVAGESTAAGRLLDLGFVPGTSVHVLRCAPFGDPLEYELRGYRLCLRRVDASRVRVRPVAPAPA